jgi:regulator of RNase E activity RraB
MMRFLLRIILVLGLLLTAEAMAMPDWFVREFGFNDVGHQLAMNPVTIAALADAGSDLAKPHRIEHHFYCHDERVCQELSAAGEGLGYEAGNWGVNRTADGHTYRYFDLIKPIIPSQSNLDAAVKELVLLATQHQAKYDGWGSSIVE